MHGIHTNLGALTATGNTIFDLTNSAANESSGIDASVTGLVGRFTGNGTISGNTIYNLQSTTTVRGRAIGIYFHGSQNLTNRISENFVHSLSVATSIAGPPFGEIYGIRVNNGAGTYSNNIISLGTGISSNAYIYGIYEPGTNLNNCNLYHNTVYIGGASAQNENNSYAFFSSNNQNIKLVYNNIFHNARTNGSGTSYHSAVHYQINANGLTSDYNVYYYSPTGYFARIGPPAPLTLIATLADWQALYPTQDINSVADNSNFALPGGTAAANYIPGNPYNGFDNVGILTDYNGTVRDCNFTRGAFEVAGAAVATPVFVLGATSGRCQGAEIITYTATVFNATSLVYSLDAASITGGVTIVATTGEVSYPAGWSGITYITATATGCDGSTATATHEATTASTLELPVFLLGATSTRCQGAETITYTATAANSTSIGYSLDGASITGGVTIVATTGEVSYPAGWSGTTVITATAEGCGGPLTADHTVTITPSVGIPVFDLGPNSSRCQSAGSVTYTATATNNTGIIYTIDAASITGGVVIDVNTGEVTYPGTWAGTTFITATAQGCNGPVSAVHEALSTTALPVSVTITVAPPGAICAGGSLTFTAAHVNGGPDPLYEWQLSTDGGFIWNPVGGDNPVYGPVILNNGDQVRCRLTSNDPCADPAPVFSNIQEVGFGVVEVFSVANPTATCYPNLGEAFTAINDGDYQGTITVRILDNTIEPVTAVLNASGTGSSFYIAVSVYPTVAGLSVTGNLDAPMIRLNGADAVTIYGGAGGTATTRDLTIVNLNTGPNASTIQLDNGAINNFIRYCNIRGSGSSTNRGSVYIGQTGTGGNTDNQITNNSFSGNGANRPANSVYSFTTTGSNTGYINDNEFYDFLSLSQTSNGVYLHTGSGTWRVNNNRFYETTDFSPVNDVEFAAIRMLTTGNSNQIRNNNIGGRSLSGTDTWRKEATADNPFYGIFVRGTTHVSIAGTMYANNIHNFDWNNDGNASWTGIHADSSSVFRIGTPGQGNIIGATSGVDNIILTNGATSNSTFPEYTGFFGINYGSQFQEHIQNNTIGAITTRTSNGTYSCHAFGIAKFTSGTNTVQQIRDNIVFNITAASASTANPQIVYGIASDVSWTTWGLPNTIYLAGNVSIHNNTINNLTNNSTYASIATDANSSHVQGIRVQSYFAEIYNNVISNLSAASAAQTNERNASVIGISTRMYRYILLSPDNYNYPPGTVHDTLSREGVRDNRIFNLFNTADAAVKVYGIYYDGGTEEPLAGQSDFNTVTRNFIYNLGVQNTNGISQVAGFYIATGPATFSNNIISIGKFSQVSTPARAMFNGFNQARAGTVSDHNFYFNTVYIEGTAVNTSVNSFAIICNATGNRKNIRNNIFQNVRTGGTSVIHGSISLPGITNLTIGYNNYFVSGPNIGQLGGTNHTFASWVVATSEVGSENQNSDFMLAGGDQPLDYLPTNPKPGIAGTGILVDFSESPRNCNNTMGAWETRQVQVLATLGDVDAYYTKLADAFSHINDGTHRGDIQVIVNCNIYEIETAVLYQSGYNGTSDYNWIRVYPSEESIRVFFDLNAPLILLDGADNVTFYGSKDGIGTNRSLTFENELAGSTVSTFMLLNGASNNTISWCNIKGTPLSQDYGIITIGSGANNQNNTISWNDFTGSGTNRPTNVIRVAVPSNSAFTNTGTISNNLFHNFLRPALAGATPRSNGINLDFGSSAWTIANNSFYETTVLTTTNAIEHAAIRINNNSASGINFNITGNYIGGNDSLAVGTWEKTGNNNVFYGIYLTNYITPANNTRIAGNTIRGFNWINSNNANWTAIHIERGQATIGGPNNVDSNIIGSGTDPAPIPPSIRITSGATGAMTYGINDASPAISTARLIQRNTIGSISTNNSVTTASSGFAGIAKTSAVGPVNVIDNSIVNIQALSPSTGNDQHVYGIWYGNYTSGIATIDLNTIAGLTNGSGISGSNNSRLQGIRVEAANTANIRQNIIHSLTNSFGNSSPNTGMGSSVAGIAANSGAILDISRDTIYALSNTYATGGMQVTGISVSGPLVNPGNVYRNFIHSLSVTSHNQGAHVYGIRINSGKLTTVYNNIVHLTTLSPTARTIIGIYDAGDVAGDATRLYYNTVYIGGEANISSGVSNNSYALWSFGIANTKDYRNNIFYNARTNLAGTGRHSAIFFTTAPSAGTYTLDYNNYLANGTGGVLGHWGGLDFTTLATWQAATSQDIHSLNVNPLFASAGSIVATDYMPSAAMPGIDLPAITDDDYGVDNIRTDPVTMGAWENLCNSEVTDQPDPVTVCENGTTSFTVAATGTGTVTYQWQVSTNGGANWNNATGAPYSNETTAILTINPVALAMNGYLYRCEITFTDAPNPACVVTSQGAVLTINPAPTPSAIWHQ